ncbi:hypothetical protein FACS189487_01530 [Campylobacterota bacterium]|nr:hypothetical protein FACS189487_01530 [Campylobacterota bacterium]
MENGALESALVAVVGLLLLIAFVAILWQLKSRFGAQGEPLEIEKIKPRAARGSVKESAAATASKEAAAAKKSGLKKGALIVAGKTFEFEYDEQSEQEARKLLDLIKHSLALLKETKYADIVNSRARECEALIKKLKTCTKLDELAIGEITSHFREYAAQLASSLRKS